MPYTIDRQNKANVPSFHQLYRPIQRAMIGMPPLEARGYPSIANVPFIGNNPIIDPGARWHFMDLDWDNLLENPQSLPVSVSSDAPTDWEQPPQVCVNFSLDISPLAYPI